MVSAENHPLRQRMMTAHKKLTLRWRHQHNAVPKTRMLPKTMRDLI